MRLESAPIVCWGRSQDNPASLARFPCDTNTRRNRSSPVELWFQCTRCGQGHLVSDRYVLGSTSTCALRGDEAKHTPEDDDCPGGLVLEPSRRIIAAEVPSSDPVNTTMVRAADNTLVTQFYRVRCGLGVGINGVGRGRHGQEGAPKPTPSFGARNRAPEPVAGQHRRGGRTRPTPRQSTRGTTGAAPP